MAADPERRGAWQHVAAQSVVPVALVAVAAAVYGPYVADGGLTSDDWANGDSVQRDGYSGAVDSLFATLGSKPLLALLLPLPHAAFGVDPVPHLALGIALAVAVSVLLYGLLLHLGLGRLPSATVAMLVLLFPWSDSNRLWATGAINNASLSLYLLGAIVALRSLRAVNRRGLALHVLAAALYAASVFTYETTAGLALVTGAVYLTAAPRRVALTRWGIDVVLVGAAIVHTARTSVKETKPLSDQLEHLPLMATDAASLWTEALVPAGVPGEATAVVAGAIVAGAVVQVLRAKRPSSVLRAQRRWLAVAAAATLAVACSYVVYLPSVYWHPRMDGLLNRVNVLAALPLSLLVYAVLVLGWLTVAGRRRRRARRAVAVATGACVLIAIGYVGQVLVHEDQYLRAHEEQQRVLAAIERSVPAPPAGSTILTFGHPARVAPGVPVFYDNWDLSGAARLMWPDRVFEAYPVLHGSTVTCGADALELRLLATPSATRLAPRDDRVPYGLAILVDVPRARAVRPTAGAQCRRALAQLTPGPWEAPRRRRGEETG